MPATSTVRHPLIRVCDRKRLVAAMKERSILVMCRRPDLHTKYALFSLLDNGLQILYLPKEQGQGHAPVYSETLSYVDYPEALLLHDGAAWNLGELGCWVKYAESVVE